ncbi:MAG: acylhydrolase [Rikenellaceae bacterium]|nr:acylhydrolase [Rikenellaceae bacterium]
MRKLAMAMLSLVLLVGAAQLSAGPRVVFMGDSITRLWGSNDATFFTENNFVCRGIDGQTTRQMLARFQSDVIDAAPQVVVIGAGTNDIAQNEKDEAEKPIFVTIEQIAANIFKMAEMAQAAGIKVILTTTMPSNYYWFSTEVKPADMLPRLNNLLEEYAATHECGWVDYYSMFHTETGRFDERWSYDDTHPSAHTYDVMQQALMPVLEPMLNE